MWNDLKAYFQLLLGGMTKQEDGQALVEYALILALVSVVAIAILQALGVGIVNELTQVVNAL